MRGQPRRAFIAADSPCLRSNATSFRYVSERRYRRGQTRRITGFCTPNAREHQNQSVSHRHR